MNPAPRWPVSAAMRSRSTRGPHCNSRLPPIEEPDRGQRHASPRLSALSAAATSVAPVAHGAMKLAVSRRRPSSPAAQRCQATAAAVPSLKACVEIPKRACGPPATAPRPRAWQRGDGRVERRSSGEGPWPSLGGPDSLSARMARHSDGLAVRQKAGRRVCLRLRSQPTGALGATAQWRPGSPAARQGLAGSSLAGPGGPEADETEPPS